MVKNVRVKKENASGLNTHFLDQKTNTTMTRGTFADKIEAGLYPGYHVMHKKVGNKVIRIPRTNPDNSDKNNLG